MKKAFLIVLLAALPMAAEIKVIQVKHRSADKLSSLFSGVVRTSYNNEFNTITVDGSPEQIKMAEATILQYDTPRRQAEFFLRVIEASSAAQGPNDAQDLVPAELKSLLRYTRYSQLDAALMRGVEGQALEFTVAGGMVGLIQFRLPDAQAIIEVQHVRISAPNLVRTKDGEVTQFATLLQTSTSLKSGETVVLGASKMPMPEGGPRVGGIRALIVLLTAKLLP